MTRLVIAEKPSMGRAIAAALGLQGNGRSFIRGSVGNLDVVVTWCVGHLVEALEPEGYDSGLKKWSLEPLPFFPGEFRYAPIASTRDQYDAVAGLMARPEVAEVVNATDAGREGELIFDLVYRLAGCSKPVLRFWTSSLTDEAIRQAWGCMKPGDAYLGLREAARCRQEADWLVGINGTRAQTLVARRGGGEGVYSLGRVQTPTLALLVNRELEIRDFVPREFWTLVAVFQADGQPYTGKWFTKKGGKETDRFETEAEARAMAEKLAGLPGKVASVSHKLDKKRPELLYDLTALQKEANKRFGFTAEHTLDMAQSLYEAKLISYPRTNSRYLTEADAQKAAGWIKSIAQGQLAADLQPALEELRQRWPVKLDKRFVNDKEVEDHSALVPTENPARRLQGDQAKLYELIARRFLAAFFPERVEARCTVVTKIASESFRSYGVVVKELGWSAVDPPHTRKKEPKPGKDAETKDPEGEGEGQDEPSELPSLSKNDLVFVRELRPKPGKTTPPKRMTEADLLSAMQGAGRVLDDEELRGAMKDCGLGTPATRANIIETLLKRGYLERKRNVLTPTDKGIELIRTLQAESLKSPQMTGEWEARMERIRRGEESRKAFMSDISGFVRDLVASIKGGASTVARSVSGAVVGSCPRCGSDLHLRAWEDRSYVKCDGSKDPECRVSYGTDAEGKPLESCPLCQGPVRTTKSGAKVCVLCGKWQDSLEGVPGPVPCERCGQPMRVIPSTRKGQFFHRCGSCGITKEAKPQS